MICIALKWGKTFKRKINKKKIIFKQKLPSFINEQRLIWLWHAADFNHNIPETNKRKQNMYKQTFAELSYAAKLPEAKKKKWRQKTDARLEAPVWEWRATRTKSNQNDVSNCVICKTRSAVQSISVHQYKAEIQEEKRTKNIEADNFSSTSLAFRGRIDFHSIAHTLPQKPTGNSVYHFIEKEKKFFFLSISNEWESNNKYALLIILYAKFWIFSRQFYIWVCTTYGHRSFILNLCAKCCCFLVKWINHLRMKPKLKINDN